MNLYEVVVNDSHHPRNRKTFVTLLEAKQFFDDKKSDVIRRTRGAYTAVEDRENLFRIIWDGWHDRTYTLRIVPVNQEKL